VSDDSHHRASARPSVRPESWARPAGASPVRVIAGEPGSRPRSVGEIRRAERGVESLFGGSKRAGRSANRCESCSLVTVTTEEPSRSRHGEGSTRRSGGPDMPPPGPSGVWGAARTHGLVRNRRGPSSQPRQHIRPYKPMVKLGGGKRESDGVIVLMIAGRNPAGGKGPDFGHAEDRGMRKDMTETARSNHPGGSTPVVNVPDLPNRLWATAKLPLSTRGAVLDPERRDARPVTAPLVYGKAA
jgi:hypothetical protein